ncbi:MAG: GDP-L-fucose synthase [Rhodospirillales bacterium]
MAPPLTTPLAGKRVYVAGHSGMVGSAIMRRLARENCQLLTAPRAELDLLRQDQTDAWFARQRPELVFMAAAKVGGIHANDTQPAEFLHDNLAIATNVIQAAHRSGVAKLLFLGSSCIYPKEAAQPIGEDALLTGPLEPTNQWYAIAKIAGIKLCQAYRRQYGSNFIAAQPTNIYGPSDNFDLLTSHVLPALLRKAHEAKQRGDNSLGVWGSGRPRREFLHVDDLADACVFLMQHYDEAEIVNVGTGEDIAIAELARLIGEIAGFKGQLQFDASKPDGTMRKRLDVTKLSGLGWQANIGLKDGIAATYRWYLEHQPRV